MTKELTSRERVILTINHQEPDRVPIDINYSWQAYSVLREHFGLSKETLAPDIWGRVWESPDLVNTLGTDCINIGLDIPVSGRGFQWNTERHQDDYGIVWEKVYRDENFYYEMRDYPIKEPSMKFIQNYDWPDPQNPAIYEGIEERITHLYETTDLAIITLLATHVWERATFMCGNEDWWKYLIKAPDFCVALMEKLADIQRQIYLKGLDKVGEHTTILRLGGEDFGTQQGLFISPEMFQELVKPVLKSVYEPVKEKYLSLNSQGKLLFHSDGAIRDLIPDFLDLGIDILDPVQPRPEGMNGLKLRRDFGDKVVFHGGIDTQKALPFGSLEEVKEETERKIEMFAPGGGYILNPSHMVQSDVSSEKIIHMVKHAKRHGNYPIQRKYSDEELLSG